MSVFRLRGYNILKVAGDWIEIAILAEDYKICAKLRIPLKAELYWDGVREKFVCFLPNYPLTQPPYRARLR